MIQDFTYLKPGTVKEALTLLADHVDDCKIICGGQSLLIPMRQGLLAVDYLMDIKGLDELSYIKYDAKEGLTIKLKMQTQGSFPGYAIALWNVPVGDGARPPAIKTNAREHLLVRNEYLPDGRY